jgi:hypothetical protein
LCRNVPVSAIPSDRERELAGGVLAREDGTVVGARTVDLFGFLQGR